MELPELPPKHVADDLLYLYRISFHATFPMIDWQSFGQTYDSVYRQQSLRDVPQAWAALLFAVFACGTLPRHLRNGEEYSEVSRKMLDLATDDLALDHVRTAVLTSVFLVELNRKSAGWTWLGIAVRIAQDIGLHLGHVKGQYIDQVINRPVWWTIYVCDRLVFLASQDLLKTADDARLLSLELGRSAMISDTDCEPDLSSPGKKGDSLDDGRHSQSPLVPTVHVIQDISRLLSVLKEPAIPTSTLHVFDALFEDCMTLFPAHHQINAQSYIDPHQIPPVIYLQNARLVLHRHNVRIKDPPGFRSAAIDQCTRVAKDTTRFLARCMQDTPGPPIQFQGSRDPWKGSLVSAASAFFCTHIWRCALFLSFRSDYEGALLCARAIASIGNARPVNVACGRYLEFFLQRLTSRPLEGSTISDTDEELVVLASGDLQGSAQNSWVWKDGEQQPNQSNPVSPVNPTPITALDDDLTWSNWDGVVDSLQRLLNVQRQRQQQQHEHKVALSLPSQTQQQPIHLASPISPGGTETPQSGSSRIRIADIM